LARNRCASVSRGGVFVFYGVTSSSSLAPSLADATIAGTSAGDTLGWVVASGGDLDSDGDDELLISGNGAEAAYLIPGSPLSL
jgi:hypothetical protein